MYMHVINPVCPISGPEVSKVISPVMRSSPKPSVVSTNFVVQEAFKLVDSGSDSLHYVYACRKHGLSAGGRQ